MAKKYVIASADGNKYYVENHFSKKKSDAKKFKTYRQAEKRAESHHWDKSRIMPVEDAESGIKTYVDDFDIDVEGSGEAFGSICANDACVYVKINVERSTATAKTTLYDNEFKSITLREGARVLGVSMNELIDAIDRLEHSMNEALKTWEEPAAKDEACKAKDTTMLQMFSVPEDKFGDLVRDLFDSSEDVDVVLSIMKKDRGYVTFSAVGEPDAKQWPLLEKLVEDINKHSGVQVFPTKAEDEADAEHNYDIYFKVGRGEKKHTTKAYTPEQAFDNVVKNARLNAHETQNLYEKIAHMKEDGRDIDVPKATVTERLNADPATTIKHLLIELAHGNQVASYDQIMNMLKTHKKGIRPEEWRQLKKMLKTLFKSEWEARRAELDEPQEAKAQDEAMKLSVKDAEFDPQWGGWVWVFIDDLDCYASAQVNVDSSYIGIDWHEEGDEYHMSRYGKVVIDRVKFEDVAIDVWSLKLTDSDMNEIKPEKIFLDHKDMTFERYNEMMREIKTFIIGWCEKEIVKDIKENTDVWVENDLHM